MTDFPQPWIDAAAEAAHKALDEADDGWHYTCMQDPDDRSCGKGFRARAMLAEDMMPRVLAALQAAGALWTGVTIHYSPPEPQRVIIPVPIDPRTGRTLR